MSIGYIHPLAGTPSEYRPSQELVRELRRKIQRATEWARAMGHSQKGGECLLAANPDWWPPAAAWLPHADEEPRSARDSAGWLELRLERAELRALVTETAPLRRFWFGYTDPNLEREYRAGTRREREEWLEHRDAVLEAYRAGKIDHARKLINQRASVAAAPTPAVSEQQRMEDSPFAVLKELI